MPFLYQCGTANLLKKSAFALTINYAVLGAILFAFSSDRSGQLTGLIWLLNCSLAYGALVIRSSVLYHISSIGLITLVSFSLIPYIKHLSILSFCLLATTCFALVILLFNIQKQLFCEVSSWIHLCILG